MSADSIPDANRIPVEEPIIVPKKEPIHICDGTHHHVTNIVNGKVIHSCVKSTAVKEVEKAPPIRPKFLSTVSLPDIDELKNDNKNTKTKNKDPLGKGTKKQISVISLPSDKDVTLAETTAARLENYLRRCKNFNGMTPKQLLEELQLNDHNSDSDDSWDDLHDWGMNGLGHCVTPLKSPVEPRSRLNNPPIRLQPKPDEEVKKTGVDRLRDIAERRESIDDFFDTKAECVSPENELKPNTQLGRRGSDSFFSSEKDKEFYDTNINDDIPKLKSDIYYTNALLESESSYFDKPLAKQIKPTIKSEIVTSPKVTTKPEKTTTNNVEKPKQIKPEVSQSNNDKQPSKTIPEISVSNNFEPLKDLSLEDEDLLGALQDFCKAHNALAANNKTDEEISISDTDEKPKRKTGNVEHSNLLKILQDNSKNDESTNTHSK